MCSTVAHTSTVYHVTKDCRHIFLSSTFFFIIFWKSGVCASGEENVQTHFSFSITLTSCVTNGYALSHRHGWDFILSTNICRMSNARLVGLRISAIFTHSIANESSKKKIVTKDWWLNFFSRSRVLCAMTVARVRSLWRPAVCRILYPFRSM